MPFTLRRAQGERWLDQDFLGIETAFRQGNQACAFACLVHAVEHDEDGNDEIAGDEIEPGEGAGLEYADIRTEQHHCKQHDRDPGAGRI